MSKVTFNKNGMTIEADKITLGGDTTVVTGEFIVDENNHITHESDNKHLR